MHGMPNEAASQRTWQLLDTGAAMGLLGGGQLTFLAWHAVHPHVSISVITLTEVPRLSSWPVDIRLDCSCTALAYEGRAGGAVDSLSHALLARWRRKDGCPGGTDCDVAEGLRNGESVGLLLGRDSTYGVPPPGWAANGGAELAMKECSPDMLSLGRDAQWSKVGVANCRHAVESSAWGTE